VSRPVTPEERVRRGRELRRVVSRSAHAAWLPRPDRPDPIDLLATQDRSRLRELVPIRYGRMAASPLAFLRGAALPMAADLAETPSSGPVVQLCGDAHLGNFGIYASPERQLVFDVNDFDESLPGPFEWDVKRLAASLEVAARLNMHGPGQRRAAVEGAVRSYREAMAGFAGMRTLDVWYTHLDVDVLRAKVDDELRPVGRRRLARTVARARVRDNLHAFDRLTETVAGDPRILADPPLLVPLRDLVRDDAARAAQMAQVRTIVRGYRRTLFPERRALLDRFRVVDVAHKVVGVGSVGTRCWIVLLLGNDASDPLLLQVKEAGPSVLEQFLGRTRQRNAGQRVVLGQRAMQAVSDIFLGWYRLNGEGDPRDHYVRQLRDGKGGVEVERLGPDGLASYARLCGWTLARAHARTGDPVTIAAYLGSGPAFDVAVGAFARAYADQTERDHHALLDAIATERVVARSDL
jgi:uncharacterized protein (DUF2252 family)